jgi:hypothetical protein
MASSVATVTGKSRAGLGRGRCYEASDACPAIFFLFLVKGVQPRITNRHLTKSEVTKKPLTRPGRSWLLIVQLTIRPILIVQIK